MPALARLIAAVCPRWPITISTLDAAINRAGAPSAKEPASRLVEILWHRWRQENGFKHGVERWGINQLDDRGVEAVPRGTVIPSDCGV